MSAENAPLIHGEHVTKVTEVVLTYYPDHPPRTESSTFRATKRKGKSLGLRCAISGQPSPEYHHVFCEEADMLAVDWHTVKGVGTGEIKELPVLDPVTDQPTDETFPVEQSLVWALCKIAELRGFDWSAFDADKPETFVDGLANMLPLSAKFHRSATHGIHHRDLPTWSYQAFPRVAGFIFSPDELVQKEQA